MTDSETRRFAFAPMSTLFRVLTFLFVPVPFFMLVAGLHYGKVMMVLAPTAGFMLLIYGFVYFYMRPTRFVLDQHELTIVFPLRKISMARSAVARAEVVGWKEFVSRYPRPIRVGAGGLWGGFGALLTRSGKVQFYISRQQRMVLLELDGRNPLLITPDDPAALVAALRRP